MSGDEEVAGEGGAAGNEEVAREGGVGHYY